MNVLSPKVRRNLLFSVIYSCYSPEGGDLLSGRTQPRALIYWMMISSDIFYYLNGQSINLFLQIIHHIVQLPLFPSLAHVQAWVMPFLVLLFGGQKQQPHNNKFKMHYHTGNMRELSNDLSPGRQSWERENDFHYTQRSKYEKSQISYAQNQQRSKVYYDGEKTDRYAKTATEVAKDIHKNIPFKIRSPDHEDKFGWLHVQFYITTDKNQSTFTMHFTDQRDSLFLWSCYVRQAEFSQLKAKLSLRVDFHGFPEMLNDLLDLCVDLEKDSRNVDRNSYFFAVFQVKKGREEADFRILEANKYKESEHFQLNFKRANDDQLKRYLAHKFDSEKNQNQKLNRQISDITDKLNRRIEEVEKLSYEYQNLQKQKNERIEQLERREREKIQSLTLRIEEEHITKQKDEDEKNRKKVEDLNQKIDDLKKKYDDIYEKYQKANQKIFNLEGSESSLKSRNKILEQQSESLQKLNAQMKSRQIKTNQSYHELKNENTKLSCTIQSLEDKIRQKDQRLSDNHQLKSTNTNQISTLEENLRQEKKKVQKLEEKNDNMEEQMSKLKKKYEDLQQKHQKKKDKLTDYAEIIKSQEEKIEEKEKGVKKILEEISQQKREKENMDMEIKDRELKIKDLKNRLQNMEQDNQHLRKMLSNCHKQINQKRYDSGRIPSYSPINSGVGRQFSSTITSNTESRIKYSPSINAATVSPVQKSQRIVPAIKKYREGTENDRNRENSKSPIVSRLSQQVDPEEGDKTREKIGPIKFRK